MEAQWLGLCAFKTEGMSLIPGQGTKIPHAVEHCQKIKNKYFFLEKCEKYALMQPY